MSSGEDTASKSDGSDDIHNGDDAGRPLLHGQTSSVETVPQLYVPMSMPCSDSAC